MTYVGRWIELALDLDEENRTLRALVVDLAIALARERELFALAREAIEARWPGEQ